MVLLEEPPVKLGQEGEQDIFVLSEVGSIACVITMEMVGVKETPVDPLVGEVDSMVKFPDVWVTSGKMRTPSRDGEGSGIQWKVEKIKTKMILNFFHMSFNSILSFD